MSSQSKKPMTPKEAQKKRLQNWLSQERIDYSKKITERSVKEAIEDLLLVPWNLILTSQKSRKALEEYSENPWNLPSYLLPLPEEVKTSLTLGKKLDLSFSFFGPKLVVGILLAQFQKETLKNFVKQVNAYSKKGINIWKLPALKGSGVNPNYIAWPPFEKQIFKPKVTNGMKAFVRKDIDTYKKNLVANLLGQWNRPRIARTDEKEVGSFSETFLNSPDFREMVKEYSGPLPPTPSIKPSSSSSQSFRVRKNSRKVKKKVRKSSRKVKKKVRKSSRKVKKKVRKSSRKVKKKVRKL